MLVCVSACYIKMIKNEVVFMDRLASATGMWKGETMIDFKQKTTLSTE